jgi:hypothetical protein
MGCFTSANGPVVMSSFLGTRRSTRTTDQIHSTAPTDSMTIETARSHAGGPPTSNHDGNATFATTPTAANGSMVNPMRSPLPTNRRSSVPVTLRR